MQTDLDLETDLSAQSLDFFHTELDRGLFAVLEVPKKRTAVDPDASAVKRELWVSRCKQKLW